MEWCGIRFEAKNGLILPAEPCACCNPGPMNDLMPVSEVRGLIEKTWIDSRRIALCQSLEPSLN